LTYLAFFHARVGSISRPSIFSFAWWLQPVEFNATGRINRIEPGVDFTCISALPGGREIWVGGGKGVIIHSSDGGKSWQQLPMVTASYASYRPREESQPASEQRKQPKRPLPSPKSEPKALNLNSSGSDSRGLALNNSESDEWIQVELQEKAPPPNPRQRQIVPNAPNQAAPAPNVPIGPRSPRIEKSPADSANKAAPDSSPKTERGVTGIPGVQSQAPEQTRAGARPARAQRSLSSNNIEDLFCVTSAVGYTLTSAGELIFTRDGGQTWRLLDSISADGRASGIKFLDEKRGVAVGGFGVLRTLDGGLSWSPRADNYFPVSSIALTNGFNGRVVGAFPVVVEIIDGIRFGRQFEIAGSEHPDLIGITKTNSGSLFVCGKNGFIARGLNGGEWRALKTGTTAELDVIFFASDQVGWAVGKKATIITTRDGGEHWTRQITDSDKDLTDIYFSSESHGLVAGGNGTVLGTDDGGEHWYPVVVAGSTASGGYGWLPAPWYFASLLLLFGLVRRIPDEIPPPSRQGIAELLASDKPIGPGDPDYLGFQQTALGLSNYLRNSATKPPLTVAVTGEWGMGKSSLMNLVQGDLRSYKFRPVWFNAWHHQTEESLLAALLENVRTQAIPSIFTPEGIVFRVKLLWLRARRNLFVFLLVVAAVAFCITYFATPDPHQLTQRSETWTELRDNPLGAIDALVGNKAVSQALLVLVSAVGALTTFLKWFRAIGADPSDLLASKSNAAKAKDLRAQTSFRYRFENQFREVANSLHPLTMVLFVDDLDRCRPEQVYDMLEAINFLVSCGDCFVIMGFARRRVERCVGLVFDKVAAEGPTEIDGHRLTRAEQRQRFAQLYLEKLINIEVPVPKGGLDQIRTLLISKREEPPPRSKVEIAGEKLSELVPHLIPASLAVVVAIIAVWYSLQLVVPRNSGLRTAAVAASPPPSAAQSANQPQRSPTPGQTGPTPAASPAEIGSAKFFPGQADRSSLWAILLLSGGILTPGIIRLSRRTGSVIEDSPAFTEALDKWFPFLITGREMTPRAIKRFVNRVRYFAMMEGSFRPVRRWWERLAQFLKRKKESPERENVPAPTDGTREDLLVALATVHERQPEWFTGDFESFLKAVRSVSSEAIADDITTMNPATYEHFKKLVAGVEVR
jgi:photosystem II stability/assembly factor-like uncharacterized protein